MTNAKERFDILRAKYLSASEAARAELITQAVKYGTERNARSWASRGEKNRLAKIEARRNKAADAIVEFIVSISPRGDAWRRGVPCFWIYSTLSWDDVIRPATEPLSVIPPAAWGWSEQDVRRHLKT